MIRNDAREKIAIRKAPMESVLDPKSAEMIRWQRPGQRSAWFGIMQPDPA
jgi:hypothetical protein